MHTHAFDVTSLSSLSDELLDPDVFLQSLDDDMGDFGQELGAAVEDNGQNSMQQTQRTKKQPKTRNYDPNKARSEKLRELQRLRVEATDLELKLQQLQTAPNGPNSSLQHNSLNLSTERDAGLPAVWEEICARQFERRLRAEQENCRLKKKYKAEMKAMRAIEKLLSKRLALQDFTSEAGKCVRRVEIPTDFIEHVADRIFEELAVGVEVSYHEVERVLGMNCPVPVNVETQEPLLREGMSIELFDRRTMPFGLPATGDAWWRRWQKYRGQYSDGNTGDVIRERCGLEMIDVKTDKSATFYVQQVLRWHVEERRTVIVWNSYFEPFTFGQERVHGVHFLLKGYVLMKPVEGGSTEDGNDTGDTATLVLTCYSITPHCSDPTMRKNTNIRALIKFVVSATSANISTSNEMMENLLVDDALEKCW